MSARWETLASLPLAVQRCELSGLSLQISEEFERKTTVVHLHGNGFEGVGEDVTYDPAAHDLLQATGPPVQLGGDHTLASFSDLIGTMDLFPEPPENEAYRLYRTWAFESAALDLALRQAGLSLHQALGLQVHPVKFVGSLRLGNPPALEPLLRRLELAPGTRFKLDPTPDWSDKIIAELVDLDAVATVDLKGFYEGTIVDNPPDPDLYRRVANAFPGAWIEDPRLIPETEPALAAHLDRITWDAPIHTVGDIEALPFRPHAINIKPSRIGTVKELLAIYRHCSDNQIACYGGGQTELGPGRGQIQYLASIFHPDGPNDVAPSSWNLPVPPPDLPASPLQPAPSSTGFRWAQTAGG